MFERNVYFVPSPCLFPCFELSALRLRSDIKDPTPTPALHARPCPMCMLWPTEPAPEASATVASIRWKKLRSSRVFLSLQSPQLSLKLIACISMILCLDWLDSSDAEEFQWPDLKANSCLAQVSWEVAFVLFSGNHGDFPWVLYLSWVSIQLVFSSPCPFQAHPSLSWGSLGLLEAVLLSPLFLCTQCASHISSWHCGLSQSTSEHLGFYSNQNYR